MLYDLPTYIWAFIILYFQVFSQNYFSHHGTHWKSWQMLLLPKQRQCSYLLQVWQTHTNSQDSYLKGRGVGQRVGGTRKGTRWFGLWCLCSKSLLNSCSFLQSYPPQFINGNPISASSYYSLLLSPLSYFFSSKFTDTQADTYSVTIVRQIYISVTTPAFCCS